MSFSSIWENWFRRGSSPLLPPGAPEYRTLPFDGVPWDFSSFDGPVVAVGDVQGDLRALDAVLRAAALTDESGRWTGGRAHLVLLGDLVGGDEDSRLVVEWVIRLTGEARKAGGRVEALLGNHDVLPAAGDVSKMTGAERRRYQDPPVPGADEVGAKAAFRGDSDYARWLHSRNALIRVGSTLFAHAGVDSWLLGNGPGEVNATVRAWIRHWQGTGPIPPEQTRWAVGDPGMDRDSDLSVGPLWNRTFKPGRGDGRPSGAPKRDLVRELLGRLGVERLVIGHAPTPEAKILLEHPYFGNQVVMVDTRLSDRKNGRLEALSLSGGTLAVVRAKQKDRASEATDREEAFLDETRAARGTWGRSWRRLRDWLGWR